MLSHLSSPKHKAFRSGMGNTLLVTKLTDTVSGVFKDEHPRHISQPFTVANHDDPVKDHMPSCKLGWCTPPPAGI